MLSQEDLVRQYVKHLNPLRHRVQVLMIDPVLQHVEVTDGEKQGLSEHQEQLGVYVQR